MSDQAEKLRLKVQNMTKQAKVIAIVSGKGGVGKSTFSVNFALGLAQQHKKVLAIDMDIGFGNLDILMGLNSPNTISDVLKGTHKLEDIIEMGPKGISYIGAGSGLNELTKVEDFSFQSFTDQLEKLSESYHYILLDMGAGLTEESLKFILSADEVVAICTPEPTSIRDAYSMLKYITKLGGDIPFKIAVNRVHSKSEGKETYQKIKTALNKFLNKQVSLLGYIQQDDQVVKSIVNQSPIVLSNPNSKPARAIQDIVSKFLTGEEVIDTKETFTSKLTRFFKR
ncbi:MinD/ParA family protein (plasmid) [Rossellomorea sp. AcN35-11]|nr:MinD/ParA family protein [Rossellomorea aquimaris]WJV32301.1 MinD/ParA family protein [Rossellomorea sp. AcN35-11]